MGAERCVFAVLVLCQVMSVLTASSDNRLANVTSHSHMDILMKGAKPLKPDAYLCTSYEVTEEEAYIVKFEALAEADTAHHILMYGCEEGAFSTDNIWDCPPACRGPQQIMFAWAKNAPPTQLPDGVGFKIGTKTSIRTIVMQIHYARSFEADEAPDRSGIRLHISHEKQPYVAGIFLLMSFNFAVPPDQEKYHVDMSCQYTRDHALFPFAYRTHAHGLGRVIAGYQFNISGFHLVGKGNPQWPQAFYPSDTGVQIKSGDFVVGRCTYDSTGMDHSVRVGATNDDEMCNFYIMFYTNASVQNPFVQCGGNQLPYLSAQMPADSDVPLPPNPLLDMSAHGHHHHHHHAMPHPSSSSSSSSSSTSHHSKPTASAEPLVGKLTLQADWLTAGQQGGIGQVGGLATDKQGNVYVFHRGSRIWDRNSFDFDNNFQHQSSPIMENTIKIFSRDGKLIRQFGSGDYYMPHGITVDSRGNVWLTDVALHQVFRVQAGESKANLTLGEAFVHRQDAAHFCKPTDVAVLASGDFFVSDGYCNSRIMKFSKEGNLLKQWGRPDQFRARIQPQPNVFTIPHSLALAEDLNLVCVADRENGRIQCFDLDGTFKFIIQHQEFGPRLFAIEYCPRHGGLLFAVNGPTFDGETSIVQGFTISVRDNTLLETWTLPTDQGLQNPHDVAVDVEGHSVYVGELNPSTVWKFQRVLPTTTSSTIATAAATHKTGPEPQTSKPSADKKDSAAPSSPTNGSKSNNPASLAPSSDHDSHTHTYAAAGSLAKDIKGEGKGKEEVSSDFTPSIIIGVLLVIPVVLLLVITLIMRWHHRVIAILREKYITMK